LVLLLSIQTSSLWGSLILVPIRLILVIRFSNFVIYSGLIAYIFIIVFIGGLIVLLVRIASLISQEQSIRVGISTVLLCLRLLFLLIFWTETSWDWGSSVVHFLFWLNPLKNNLIFYSFVVLVIALIGLSKLAIEFKSIARSV